MDFPFYLSQTLCLEIGVAALIAVAILSVRIEYALFLYALALGFPDLAYPLGSTINIRLDDLLIPFFLARTFLWRPAPLSSKQKSIFIWQAVFLAVCLVSIAIESAQGNPPAAYDAAKMLGCAAILFVLPRLLQSERRLKFFVSGLMCAGVALVVQVHQHLGENSSSDFANFQELKSAATFSTWNPNTIGQAMLVLVFAAGLGGILFSRTFAGRIPWACLAMGFALVPVSLFVRGTSLSIAAAILLYLCLLRRWRWAAVFVLVGASAVLYLHSRDRQLLEDAATVNVSTGEGFSHRFDRWDMALQAIQKRPWAGQGFGQELNYLTLIGSEGRAHDAYLTVWLELGLGGLLLLLWALFRFFRAGWQVYRDPSSRARGALIVALLLALCLDSLGLPTIYWEKLPTIAFSLAIAVIGICERAGLELPETGAREMVAEPIPESL